MVLKAWQLVVLATVLALGLALYQLDHESFWHDEFVTLRGVWLPFAEVWSYSTRIFHPPLYFWFLHGWLEFAPLDEFWLRLPSALFFALTVPVVYRVGRDLAGSSRAGVYAAFLAATYPFLLHHGQEARPYAMLTFFAACGFAAAARLMCGFRDGTRTRFIGAGLVNAGRRLARGDFRRSWQVLGDDGAWAVYIVSSIAVMGLHNTAGFYPMVTGLILVCAIGAAPSFRGVRFASLCIAMALIALLYSPQVPILLSGVSRVSLPYAHLPDARGILIVFRETYGGGGYVALILLTLLAVGAMAAWARRGRWEWAAFALLGWLLAPMLLIAFSFWKPILYPRLWIWTLIPFLAACGAGLAFVPWTLVRAAALAVLLALNLQGVAEVWKFVRYDWKGVSRTIEREAVPGAAVLVCPAWWLPQFDHYWGGTRQDLRFHVADVLDGRERMLEIAGARPKGRWGPDVRPAGLFAQYPEVWLISGWSCRGILGFVREPLEELGQAMKTGKYGRAVRLELYGKRE